jgi:hypothetical protein
MKIINIPHHDYSPNYFCYELCGNVATFTNPQTFYYLEKNTKSYVYEPQQNSQFYVMMK